MSQNPWPVLLVGLGSLGFLAASMAQQTDPNGFPPASIQIPSFDELEFNSGPKNAESRWSDGKANAESDSNSPAETGVRLGGVIEDIKELSPASEGRRSAQEARRFADGAQLRLRDTQPAAAQAQGLETKSPRRWGRSVGDSAIETEPIRSRIAQRNSRLSDDRAEEPALSGPLFDTRETAIIAEPPSISANRSSTPAANPSPTAGPATPAAVSQGEPQETEVGDPENTGGEEGEKQQGGKLPLWDMALFASIAANLFFCWIAWDNHSKYQDLVEDISESDTRRERQTRRLRKEDGGPRRTRDADDSDFLRAGAEG